MPFAPGESVGAYRVIEELGHGGMATVYKAYHAALDRYVAIKVLHPAFLEDASFHQRFDREAKVIAKLEHPNIVPIYDYAEHHGQPYLVMKYIEGETLKARLARGPLSQQEMLDVVRAVGEALNYAHSRGVLHRDIKPSNVLLGRDGHIFLSDFGLARMAQSGTSTLSSDVMLGTPQYISPEQARGQRELDERTDVYSFGVLLYELVVGRVPFRADTPFSIIHDHIYSPLPLPRSISPGIPEAVELVLLKALDKDPRARFATVAEMVTAFHAAVAEGRTPDGIPTIETTRLPSPATRPAGHAESAKPSDMPPVLQAPPPPTRPAARRSRAWLWAAGGLGMTCLCLIPFVVAANRSPTGSIPSDATAEPPTAVVFSPSPSPDLQRALAAVEADPSSPQARLALADAYFARGDLPSAYGELTKAGSLQLANEEYVSAARLFARALELGGGPDRADKALVDGLVHALFFAVEGEEGWRAVDELVASYPGWGILMPVHARSLVLRDELEQGRLILVRSLARNPEDAVARSVLAEMRLKAGSRMEARQVAERTLAYPLTPDWLRPFLEAILQASRTP